MSSIHWHPSIRNKQGLKRLKIKNGYINCCYHEHDDNSSFFLYDATMDSKDRNWRYINIDFGEEIKKIRGVEKWFSNENKELDEVERDEIQRDAETAMEDLLHALRIDTKNDHNAKETAKRVAKMYVKEVFRGRYEAMPRVTAFPNAQKYDQIYLTGPITIRSTCAHHFQNITGKCWIGLYPGKKVVGLSKFNRLVDWVASRPQIQEEMTVQIADLIEEQTKAAGVAVVIKAEHHCMTHRGVKEHDSDMTTSIVRGVFREDTAMKSEFFALLQGMKGFNG